MDVSAQEEQALRAELREARERLRGLERELESVDAELEELSVERQQHVLLEEACVALEKLGQLGAAELFWGERMANGAGEEHLRGVRGRLDAFQGHMAEIEGRRQAVLERIRSQEEQADLIAADVLDLQEREARRKLEWIVEREASPVARVAVMPWSRGGEDDERLRKSLAAALLLSLLLALVMPMIDLPLPEPWEVEAVPERLARLIREERPKPPPVPVREQPKPEEKLEPVEELAKKEVEPKPTSPAKPKPEAKGILAFREKFAGLAEGRSAPRLGAQARISNTGDAPKGLPQRNMVATLAPGSSGGINLASLSRDLGGGGGDQIEGVQVARATSSIGGATGSERPTAGGPSPGRTDEEIQIVFDRHKAALYRLYNRELRRDPTLRGQMVLRLTIEPDGSVSLCRVQASDMDAPQLASQVVERVRSFDFGAKDVAAVTILYPIDFLPAT